MTAFFTMGEDRAGYLVEMADDRDRSSPNPDEPADRGLHLRPVRLMERAMTDEHEPTGAATQRPGPGRRDPDASRTTVRPHLDRDERESRTPSCGWARSSRTQILRRPPGPDPPRRRAGAPGHPGRPGDQRSAARAFVADRDRDRDPAAGRARPALPALARPRQLRARADGRPRRLGRQAGPQAGADPPLGDYAELPRNGQARR